jgi:hypothetical protein
MDGIFIRKKPSVYHILLLLLGAFLVAIYFFPTIVDKNATHSSFSILLFGIVLYASVIPSMMLNHGAYFRMDESSIKAKYHWFGRLDCTLDDVAFVLPQVNTLSILLKNGKRHVIMGIQNPWQLSYAIRKQTFVIETETPDILRGQLQKRLSHGKKLLYWSIAGMILMLANIFIAYWLTGGRDIPEFTRSDRTVFVIMGIIELLTVFGTFYMANRCGKDRLPAEYLRYRLRNAVVTSQPLPSNKICHVYTDLNCMRRLTVCGFPNDESVHLCAETVTKDFELVTVQSSSVFSTEDEMMEKLDEDSLSQFIEITSNI